MIVVIGDTALALKLHAGSTFMLSVFKEIVIHNRQEFFLTLYTNEGLVKLYLILSTITAWRQKWVKTPYCLMVSISTVQYFRYAAADGGASVKIGKLFRLGDLPLPGGFYEANTSGNIALLQLAREATELKGWQQLSATDEMGGI